MSNPEINLYHLEILRIMNLEKLEDLLQDIQFLKLQPINPHKEVKGKVFRVDKRHILVSQEFGDANWWDMNSLRYHVTDSGFIWDERSKKADYNIISNKKYSKQEVERLRNQQP